MKPKLISKMPFEIRMDSTLPDEYKCEWCGETRLYKLRISLRFPEGRSILFCTSCRAREAAGMLDDHGKPIANGPKKLNFLTGNTSGLTR